MVIPLRTGKDALRVRGALIQRALMLPDYLRKSLTYDQDKEMSQHILFSVDTNMTVYFADPASPWQRGTNENTNGLIRQFFPKGTDLPWYPTEDLIRAEGLLNGRPRAVLGYETSKEAFMRLVALDC